MLPPGAARGRAFRSHAQAGAAKIEEAVGLLAAVNKHDRCFKIIKIDRLIVC